MIVSRIDAQDMQWFACRVKRRQAGGIRTVRVGGEFEAYRDRAGRVRKRRVDGTGERVFLPEHLLRRAGFEVFLPVKKVLRRKNRFSPEKVLVSQPLLVDWMFVGWPDGEGRWHDLMELDVVTGVLGTGGRPVEIPQSEVMTLMRVWGSKRLAAVMRKRAAKAEVGVGDRARVVDGPFEGVSVRVIEAGGASVRALVNLLGGDIEMDIRADLLEKL